MASVASASPDLEASENGNLSNLRKNELAKRLQDAGIKYSTDAVKVELQALCALSQQGVLRRETMPDAVLVAKVVGWINLQVKDQVKLLKEKKLDTSGHRWDHIEVLITDELDQGEAALKELKVSTPSSHASSISPNVSSTTKSHTPPAVVNLLITSIFADVSRNALKWLPGCPLQSTAEVLQHLDKLPRFKSPVELTKVLDSPWTEAEKLLSWICETHGDKLQLATDEFHISGFPDRVVQLILNKPDAKRHSHFIKQMKSKSQESILLFHGTDCGYLWSILSGGFKPSGDTRFGPGNFMAEEPVTSYAYATKGIAGPKWKNANEGGLMFGCQVLGKGRPVRDGSAGAGGIHVINDLSSIAIRYIFLLPPQDLRLYPSPTAPSRAAVRSTMMNAFKKFPDPEM